MTIDEAMGLLDLLPSASADEIRRAYLRKLPGHKPELDPAGFTRLRAAYECARRHSRDRASSLPDDADDADDVTPGRDMTTSWSLRQLSMPGAGVVLLPVHGQARWLDDLQACISALDHGREDDRAEALLATLPDEPQAYRVAFALALRHGHRQLGTRILGRGVERGWLELCPLLLLHDAASLSRDALEDIHDRVDDIRTRVLVAVAMAARDGDRALTLCLGLLDDARALERLPTHARELYAVILICHREGDIRPGRDLLAALEARIDALGVGLELDETTAARAKLVQELSALPDDLPGPVRAILARGILGADLDGALRDLDEYARRQPRPAMAAAIALYGHAPCLARICARPLQRHHQPPHGRGTGWLRRLGRALLAALAVAPTLAWSRPCADGDRAHEDRP